MSSGSYGTPAQLAEARDTLGAADFSPGLLYHAVGLGMCAYGAARFEVVVAGREHLRVRPGTLLVASHRSDHDVPLLCGALYAAAQLWRRGSARVAFAVRDDLFEPGFLGGYPPRLPRSVRTLLGSLDIGPTMQRRLGCFPIRSAQTIRLPRLLRLAPALAVDVLPPDVVAAAIWRSTELGRPAPRRLEELLQADYADLVWRGCVDRRSSPSPLLDEVWQANAAAAMHDFRLLVDLLRGGRPLLIFPEGRPSPDGAIGPLLPGFAALARRGNVGAVQPIALSYDDIGGRRPRAFVSIGAPIAPSATLEDDVLEALRRATPLTAGQLASRAAANGGALSPSAVRREVAQARAVGRPVDAQLLAADIGLEHVLAQARASPATAARLRRELESARTGVSEGP